MLTGGNLRPVRAEYAIFTCALDIIHALNECLLGSKQLCPVMGVASLPRQSVLAMVSCAYSSANLRGILPEERLLSAAASP